VKHTIVYDEWNPKDYRVNWWQGIIVYMCEKLTGMKVLALYRIKEDK